MVQPLMRGAFDTSDKLKAKLMDLVPFGTAENFQSAFPYGLVSKPRKGVLAYFQNLLGYSQNPIILSHLDQKRPTPSAEGETILYCSADGSSFPVKITLLVDGTLKIEASTKVQVVCDDIALGEGTVEKILNGETFQTFFNQHTHLGNLGVPTGAPMVPSDATHLSEVVTAKTTAD